MVAAARRRVPLREVARRFHVALATVQFWMRRAGRGSLDQVDWSDRPRGPRRPSNRFDRHLEDLVLSLRRHLHDASDLGECGAEAIRRELLPRGLTRVPALRTIGRILLRRGALDGRRRQRRPPPPRGWYLPDLARGEAELDAFDAVEGLVIQGGTQVEVLNAVSLHGGLVESWPDCPMTAKKAVKSLIAHWRRVGLPAYGQFDNDTRFQDAHQFPDTVGRISRLCLSLGVTPVFTPPRETGFQAAIEAYNGLWQAKVWARFHHNSLTDLQATSKRYVKAHRRRSAARIETAPPRRPFPKDWRLNLQTPLRGKIIYLRRTTDDGTVELLGHRFLVDPQWPHRLVRAEVDLDASAIRFFALRRRDPSDQPLLREIIHVLPNRRFLG